MRKKLRSCRSCRHYDTQLLRCRNGFSNPRSKTAAREIAAMMGEAYICPINRKELLDG